MVQTIVDALRSLREDADAERRPGELSVEHMSATELRAEVTSLRRCRNNELAASTTLQRQQEVELEALRGQCREYEVLYKEAESRAKVLQQSLSVAEARAEATTGERKARLGDLLAMTQRGIQLTTTAAPGTLNEAPVEKCRPDMGCVPMLQRLDILSQKLIPESLSTKAASPTPQPLPTKPKPMPAAAAKEAGAMAPKSHEMSVHQLQASLKQQLKKIKSLAGPTAA